jgi:hypothetical protein
MKLKLRYLIPLAVVLALALPACNDNLDDEDISQNLPSMVSFQPLVGFSDILDVLTVDDPNTALNECTDTIRSDSVTVTVDGNPRSSFATTFPNDVILTDYQVEFVPLDAAVLDTELPADFSGVISQEIPVGTTTSFSIEIVRIQDKQGMIDLACSLGPSAGDCGAVGANCGVVRQAGVTVIFTGEDVAGNPATLVGFLTIEFGDFGDAPGATLGL